MKYCYSCGSLLQRRLTGQGAEQRERGYCPSCHETRYENPRVLVSSVICWEDQLLFCRRAENPSIGKWALPAGFLELGERLEVAAARESFEETGVVIAPEDLHLYAVSSLVAIGEIYVCFRGRVHSNVCVAGPETLEVRFFAEREMPWHELAYPEAQFLYKIFFAELSTQHFGIHLISFDGPARERNYPLADCNN